MKFLVGLMVVWFILGARTARRGKSPRAVTLLATCLLISYAYYSYRGV